MSRKGDAKRVASAESQAQTVARQLAKTQAELRTAPGIVRDVRQQRERAEKLAEMWADRHADERRLRIEAEKQVRAAQGEAEARRAQLHAQLEAAKRDPFLLPWFALRDWLRRRRA